eukprot:9283322-Alexandrium_andersonii.AAC.1
MCLFRLRVPCPLRPLLRFLPTLRRHNMPFLPGRMADVSGSGDNQWRCAASCTPASRLVEWPRLQRNVR